MTKIRYGKTLIFGQKKGAKNLGFKISRVYTSKKQFFAISFKNVLEDCNTPEILTNCPC